MHPWDRAVLLRGDEGLAPLGQEAQGSQRICLLHQGTEMVHIGWPLAGQGPDGRLAGDKSQGESSSEWLSEPSATRRQPRKPVRGTLLSSGIGDPLAPPTPLALQNLGRAALA